MTLALTVLTFFVLAAYIWAIVASVAAQEWRERALAAEDALDDLADEVSGRRST